MVSPFAVTGAKELRALIHGNPNRPGSATDQGTQLLASSSTKRPIKGRQEIKKADEKLCRVLRLMNRLGPVNPRQREGRNIEDPFMARSAQSKRISKMLDIVNQGKRKAVNEDFGRGLLANKSFDSLRTIRQCISGLERSNGASALEPPIWDRESDVVEWAGLRIPIAKPEQCSCGSRIFTANGLSRYGPTAVLDAAQIHLALRLDVKCQACKKISYCNDDDVRRHCDARGIFSARAATNV